MRYFPCVLVIMLTGVTTLFSDDQIPDKALCSVCALKGGETELEKVKAHSVHNGEVFYFCSKNCKREFDLDPLAYLPPIFPRPAPAFVVETLGGEDMALRDLEGKVVLMDFWAAWCKPCLKTMPQLQKLYRAHSDKGLEVWGVSIDADKDRVKKIKKMVDKMDISYPIFLDTKKMPAWHQFKVKAIPAMFLLDGDSQIVAQWVGEIDYGDVEKAVVENLDRKAKVESP